MKTKKQQVSAGIEGPAPFLSLEHIEARKEFAIFGSENKTEYEEKIKKLSSSELVSHAMSVGLRPNGNEKLLKVNLVKNFVAAASKFQKFESDPIRAIQSQSMGEGRPENGHGCNSYEEFIAKFRPA